MQFNDTAKKTALDAFAQLKAPVREQMQFSSVMLRNGQFTGSGVLVMDRDNLQGIVTAKHNLCVNANIPTPTQWNDIQVNDLVVQFLTGLVVGYDFSPGPLNNTTLPRTLHAQELNSHTSDIEFRNGYGRWDYDLMFIAFKDPGLAIRQYMASAPSHRIAYSHADMPFYQQDMVGKTVFVTGFGDVLTGTGEHQNLSHPWQVRNSRVFAHPPQVLRHSKPAQYYTDVLSLEASDSSSSAPGDSGGPVWHVAANGKVYLLGVTLGSNFLYDSLPPDRPIINNAATYLFAGGYLF